MVLEENREVGDVRESEGGVRVRFRGAEVVVGGGIGLLLAEWLMGVLFGPVLLKRFLASS